MMTSFMQQLRSFATTYPLSILVRLRPECFVFRPMTLNRLSTRRAQLAHVTLQPYRQQQRENLLWGHPSLI